MQLIDVHVALSPEYKDFHNECLASLEGQPVNIFTLPGVPYNTGAARRAGYKLGSSEWVSFVDDDDRVLPGAFERINAAIKKYPQAKAFFTLERIIDEEGRVIREPQIRMREAVWDTTLNFIFHSHHLMVFNRKLLEPILASADLRTNGLELLLCREFCARHPFVKLPFIGYEWRKHSKGDRTWRQWNTTNMAPIKLPL